MLSNHVKRIFTAALLLPIVLLSIYQGFPLFDLFVLAGVFFGIREFYQLIGKRGIRCFQLSGILLSIGITLLFVTNRADLILCGIIVSGIILFCMTLTIPFPFSETLPGVGCTFLGLFYVPCMMGFLILIRGCEGGEYLILLLLIMIWTDDTAAYYTGHLLGKHAMCPTISPKKTVEGAVGGLLGSILAALFLRPYWLPQASITLSLLLGLAVGIVCQLGDLSESVLKRWAGVKESGSLLPGHGGLLDRVDGLLFSAPLFYYYFRFLIPK